MICPDCDGRGWVFVETDNYPGGERVDCETCDGTGETEDDA